MCCKGSRAVIACSCNKGKPWNEASHFYKQESGRVSNTSIQYHVSMLLLTLYGRSLASRPSTLDLA